MQWSTVLSDSILAKLQPEDVDVATVARNGPTILFNGHTVQVSPDTSIFVDHEGKNYQLLQFHFHTPSENRMDGHSSASEMHMVHKASDGSLMVIAKLNDNPTSPPSHPSAQYSSALKSIHLLFDPRLCRCLLYSSISIIQNCNPLLRRPLVTHMTITMAARHLSCPFSKRCRYATAVHFRRLFVTLQPGTQAPHCSSQP